MANLQTEFRDMANTLYNRRQILSLSLGLVSATALSACTTPGEQVQGYMIDEKTLADVKPGMDAQKVLAVLGTPSTVSTIGNQSWYYISQKTNRTFMFSKAEITDQRVVAVYFSKALKVERIGNFGLKDGAVFDFLSNTTPTGGEDLTILRQLLRVVG
jgi:outer membrane protein assembly factor BamE (lipoprotein component of BamABCDE complex)